MESQVHRQLASGLPMPIGFKNGTGGSVQVAVDACLATARPHSFLGTAPDGRCAVITTEGNKDTSIVLRGGKSGPNYQQPEVTAATTMTERAGLPTRLIIDASHGNSGNDASRQSDVTACIADQVAAGNRAIAGVMVESNLVAGRQEPPAPGSTPLARALRGLGVRREQREAVITPGCIDTSGARLAVRSTALLRTTYGTPLAWVIERIYARFLEAFPPPWPDLQPTRMTT